MYCPRCQETLNRHFVKAGIVHTCPTCQGHFVGMGVLRQTVLRQPLNVMWQATDEHPVIGERPCPTCFAAMRKAPVPVAAAPLEVDVCRRCHMVWFDPGEQERLPPSSAAPNEPLSPAVRQAAALQRVASMATVENLSRNLTAGDDPPDAWWKWIPAMIGLPVEAETDDLARLPWLTWWIATALLVVWLASRGNLDAVIGQFGLIPADTARLSGLTFLTSFFLHAGWLHLLGNLYFLLVFGDNVEDCLGRWRYGLLILMALLAGGLIHVVGDARADVPLVGASGGIAAVIVFYSLRFPHARLALFLRWRWVHLPAWMAFVLWVVWQGVLVWLQLRGATDVSALGHLGGVAAGVSLWLVWRKTC